MSDAEAGLKKLEDELVRARRFGTRATKEMHARVVKDLRAAEGRARRAEQRAAEAMKRATQAEQKAARAAKRAQRAERELAAVKGSTSWKVGHAVVSVPARLKRRR